jgi:hypothetical protein
MTNKNSALVLKPNTGVPYKDQRTEEKLEIIGQMCSLMKMDQPPPFSQRERVLILLTDQFMDHFESYATERMEAHWGPLVLDETIEANIPRERRWYETARFWAARVFGSAFALVGGALAGVIDAFVLVLVGALSRAAIFMIPFMFTFLAVSIGLTIQNSQMGQPLNGQIRAYILTTSAWWALLIGLGATAAYAVYLWIQREQRKAKTERHQRRQVGQEAGGG